MMELKTRGEEHQTCEDQVKFKKVPYRTAMRQEGSTMQQKEYFYVALIQKFYDVDVTKIDAFSNLKIRSLNMKLRTKVHTEMSLNTYTII